MGRMAGQPVAMAEVVRAARIAVALTEFSATAQLVSWIKESAGQLRAASLPGVLRRMEQTALAADYSVVGRHARHLADKLTRADAAVAWFDTGHTLRIDLRWRAGRADDGDCRGHTPINLINLPSGEAYIAPYEGERPGQPSRTAGEIPVRTGDDLAVFTVAANTIQAVQGDGPLAAHYRGFFAADPARRNIAELGLGCNDRAIVTGNVLEDEKAGFHWAYGRSENWGGVTGPEQFLGPATVVHHDVVYARGSPIGMARVALEYPDGTQEEILRQGNYVNLP
jgi:leucyl aminopeptidase (aminopeptidase T)